VQLKLARIKKDRNAELAAHQKLRDLLADHFKKVQMMHDLGRISEAYFASVQNNLHRAEAELAAALGHSDREIEALNSGLPASRRCLDEMLLIYESGSVSLDMLITAIHEVAWFQIRQAELAGNADSKHAAMLTMVRLLLELWREVHARYESGRVGGEAFNEAIARRSLLEAVIQIAELPREAKNNQILVI
jgi:hypothetical protein